MKRIIAALAVLLQPVTDRQDGADAHIDFGRSYAFSDAFYVGAG